MKAISLWQPWAGLIATGHKTIETRTWSTNYRGELLIHAAKKIDWNAWYSLMRDFPVFQRMETNPVEITLIGSILVKVNLVNCVRWEPKHWDKSLCRADGGFAWILEDIVPFETPIPWRGSQGFFNVALPR